VGQLVSLPRRQREAHGATRTIGNHARLRAETASRPAKSLRRATPRTAGASALFSNRPQPCGGREWRCRPERPYRARCRAPVPAAAGVPTRQGATIGSRVCAAIHHGLNPAGTARHFAPFSCRQTIAVIVRRRWRDGTFACGRQASISGSSTTQRSSVNISCHRKSEPNAPAAARLST
jgi:hypothetical protein